MGRRTESRGRRAWRIGRRTGSGEQRAWRIEQRAAWGLAKLSMKRIIPAATAIVLPADIVGIKKAKEKVTRRIIKRGMATEGLIAQRNYLL